MNRGAWQEVQAAYFVYFYVCKGVGYICICKQEARLLIDKLGSRFMLRTTGFGDCVGLEVCPF